MVEDHLSHTFTALADPTRRAMLLTLMQGEKSIGELAEPYAMSFAGAAKHVGVLVRAGLVEQRKAGRQQLCRLNAVQLQQASEWLGQWRQFWTRQLDSLDAALKADRT